MATTIQIKRSSTASAVPLAGDLEVGELAVNLADKRLFTKKSDGTVVELSTNPTDIDIATLRIDGVEVTASAAELNSLDGSTATTADLNKLAAVTATSTELNVLDGFTGSTAELNFVDGVTSNIQTQLDAKQPLDAQLTDIAGLTPTDGTFIVGNGTNFVAESGDTAIASLGITATATELNTLDGITASTAELNYTDGVTSNIQTQLDAKADLSGANFTGDVDVTGTVTADGLTVDGDIALEFTSAPTWDTGSYLWSEDGVGLNVEGYTLKFNTGSTRTNRMRIDSGGDLYLYENTGTTAKFVWDSSDEVVDIGINSKKLSLADGFLRFKRDDANKIFIGNTADALGSGTGLINYLYNSEPFIWYQGSERMRIDSSGNVGIGTSSPAYKLQIGGVPSPVLGIKSSTDSGSSTIAFGDNTANGIGYLGYDHTGNFLNVAVNGSERARIDSSGNLLVGQSSSTDPATDNVLGSCIRSGGYASFSRYDTAATLNLNKSFYDGSIVDFRKNGSTVGSIGTNAGQLTVTNGQAGLRFDNVGSGRIVPFDTAEADAAIDLGRVTNRFKDLYLSGSVIAKNTTDSVNDLMGEFESGAFSTGESTTEIRLTKDGYGLSLKGGLSQGVGGFATFSTRTPSSTTERMRLDSSGNLLVSKSSVNTQTVGIELRETGKGMFTASGTDPVFVNRLSSDGEILKFAKDGGIVGSISATANQGIIIGSDDVGLRFRRSSAGASIFPRKTDGNSSDNIIDLGLSTARFDDIYATNGTIQTSDRNEKQDIESLSDAEQRVAVACKGLLRKFRWKDAVEEKGDEARIHFGIIAQDLQDAFKAEGLDVGRYAMFISSTWTDEETGEERTRLGVRYSELLAFIIASI